jgi:radical SAM superfamily enzyme YgiQ (UPF0313 family)
VKKTVGGDNSVLILADVIAPAPGDNKRVNTDYVQYRSTPFLEVALSLAPHAPLLGPVLIGTALKEAGYPVKILECAFHPLQKENLARALMDRPGYVLITSTFIESTDAIREAARKVRESVPGAKVIIGGPSLWTNLEMRKLGDYCVIGEGEEAIAPLIDRLSRGERPEGIPGVCWFEDGKLVQTPPKLMDNLDRVPMADWSLVRRRKDEFFPLATQRGCHWRCAFCSYPANEGYKLRYLSVPRLIREIRRNHEKFGIWRYVFSDSTFTHPHERCLELLNEIAGLPFRIEWIAYGRVDNVTPELAEAMARSGCKGIFFGCDSGDDGMLLKMNKRFTSNQIRAGIAIMKRAGIPCTASWIVGFPGETPGSVRNTLNLIVELNCEQNAVHTFNVYDQAPVGLRPKTFQVTGTALNWKHGTMSSESASRWTRWVVLQMMTKGVKLGAVFDFSWMSTVGFDPETTLKFFDLAQEVAKSRFLLKPARFSRPPVGLRTNEQSLLELCERIRDAGCEHPSFSSPPK